MGASLLLALLAAACDNTLGQAHPQHSSRGTLCHRLGRLLLCLTVLADQGLFVGHSSATAERAIQFVQKCVQMGNETSINSWICHISLVAQVRK